MFWSTVGVDKYHTLDMYLDVKMRNQVRKWNT